MKKTKLFLTAFLLMAGIGMRAQSLSPQVVSSGGDFFPGGGTSLSTTFGELSITTFMPGSILTQGFQQPDDVGMSVVTLHNNSSVTVFPNPATDFITVSLSDNHSGVIHAMLYDATGKMIDHVTNTEANVSKREMVFNLSALPPSVYIISLSDDNGNELQSFRIEKVN